MNRVIAYPCPVCLKKKEKSLIQRLGSNQFFCQKCGSRLNEKQIGEILKKISELELAKIYIDEINKRFGFTYKDPVEGENPPDALSVAKDGTELKIEVTKYGPEFWSQLLTKDMVSGNVNFIQWLIDGLGKKSEKQYEPKFRKELVILLEGFSLPDDYFEKNENIFTDFESNKLALSKLGFKEIWYVSRSRRRAYWIF